MINEVDERREVDSIKPFSEQTVEEKIQTLNTVTNDVFASRGRQEKAGSKGIILGGSRAGVMETGMVQKDKGAYYFRSMQILGEDADNSDDLKLHLNIRVNDIPEVMRKIGGLFLDYPDTSKNFKVSLVEHEHAMHPFPRAVVYLTGKDKLQQAVEGRMISKTIADTLTNNSLGSDPNHTPRFSQRVGGEDSSIYLVQGDGYSKHKGMTAQSQALQEFGAPSDEAVDRINYLKKFNKDLNYSVTDENIKYMLLVGEVDESIMSHEDQYKVLYQLAMEVQSELTEKLKSQLMTEVSNFDEKSAIEGLKLKLTDENSDKIRDLVKVLRNKYLRKLPLSEENRRFMDGYTTSILTSDDFYLDSNWPRARDQAFPGGAAVGMIREGETSFYVHKYNERFDKSFQSASERLRDYIMVLSLLKDVRLNNLETELKQTTLEDLKVN